MTIAVSIETAWRSRFAWLDRQRLLAWTPAQLAAAAGLAGALALLLTFAEVVSDHAARAKARPLPVASPTTATRLPAAPPVDKGAHR